MRKKQGLAIRWHSEHAVQQRCHSQCSGMEEIPSIQEYDINFMSCDSLQVNSLSLILQN